MKTPRSAPRPPRKKDSDEYTVTADAPLLDYLLAILPNKGRSRIKAVLRDRQVLINGQPVTQFDHPLKKGMRIEIQWQRSAAPPPMQGLAIAFCDQDVIVVNKPAGLLSVATAKERQKTAYALLAGALKARGEEHKLYIVHRLDREMSGLLLFARSEAAKNHILAHWQKTRTLGHYLAVVEGKVTKDNGTITSWLTESKALKVYSSQNPQHGEKCVTHYRCTKSGDDYSLLDISLDTGHKHQIRVHMQEIGHPVAGDVKYGAKTRPLKRLALHARVLAFHHPEKNSVVTVEAPGVSQFNRLVS